MTWEMFWHGDPSAVRFFREADRLSVKRADYLAWLNGRYVYDALCATAPIINALSDAKRPADYDSEPYTDAAERKEREKTLESRLENGRRVAEHIAAMVDAFKARHETQGGDNDE